MRRATVKLCPRHMNFGDFGVHVTLSVRKDLHHSEWRRSSLLGQTRAAWASWYTGAWLLLLLLYRGAGCRRKRRGKCNALQSEGPNTHWTACSVKGLLAMLWVMGHGSQIISSLAKTNIYFHTYIGQYERNREDSALWRGGWDLAERAGGSSKCIRSEFGPQYCKVYKHHWVCSGDL